MGLCSGWGVARAAPVAHPVLVVRVDDRAERLLSSPYVNVLYPNGVKRSVEAKDDGTDPEDRFAGDRLFVARLDLPVGGKVDVVVTNYAPLPGGKPVMSRTVALAPSGTTLEHLRPPGVPVAGSSIRARARATGARPPLRAGVSGRSLGGEPGGGTTAGASEHEPEGPPIAEEALLTPLRRTIVPWDWPSLVLAALIGGAGLLAVRRLCAAASAVEETLKSLAERLEQFD